MNRTLAAAALALTLGMSVAPTFASEVTERNEALIAACPLNEAGDALLAQGLQDARYDYASGAYMAFNQLGFGKAEFKRSLASQKEDVMIRTARALHRVNDEMTLSMAKNYGLQNFFYADTLICLKGAFRETKGEAATASPLKSAAQPRPKPSGCRGTPKWSAPESNRSRKCECNRPLGQRKPKSGGRRPKPTALGRKRCRISTMLGRPGTLTTKRTRFKTASSRKSGVGERCQGQGREGTLRRKPHPPELKPSCDELARRGLPH